MEQFQNYCAATANNIKFVIHSVRESHATGKKIKSLDRKFRRNGLNILVGAIQDPHKLKDLEFTQTLLEKHANGARLLADNKTMPGTLVETEFNKSISMQRHKDNIVSIVSLLTPKKLKKKLPADSVPLKRPVKAGKIMALRPVPKTLKERAYGVR